MTNKALFLKWIKNLFYIQCVVFVVNIVGQFPIFDFVFKWISTLFIIAKVYCFYQLKPIHERYSKAFTFAAIYAGGTIVANVIDLRLLSLVISICSLIALYQEFAGHAEMLLTIDNKLSKRWRALFNWEVFGSIIVALVGTPLIMIAAITTMFDEGVMAMLTTIIVVGYSLIIQAIYIYFLKCTHDVCGKHEHWG